MTTKNSMITKTHGAVLYTRVSTGEQEKHGTSPETQRDACRGKALALGLRVIAEHHDGGISGGFLLSRAGFQAALADIQAGRADTLICPSISRYSRDVEHQQAVKKAVRAAGGRLVFCDMDFDDTPEGDLAFGIMGGFAQYEKAVIRDRTMKGRRKHAENGQQPARSISPFGYHIVTKADVLRGDYPAGQLGQYQIVEDQAQVVRELFTRYASGAASLNQLAKWLNAAGVRPPGKAAYWWASGLRYLLQNSVYKGEAHFGQRTHRMEESRLTQIDPRTGQPFKQPIVRRPADPAYTVDLSCPALVTEVLWDQAAARLSQNQADFSGNPNRVRMLAGKVVCPVCGGRMATTATGHSSYVNARGEKVFYPKERRYACNQSRKVYSVSGEYSCGSVSFMVRRTEEAALAAILSAAQGDVSLADALRQWEARQREAARRQESPEGGPAALRQEKQRVEDALTALAAQQEATVQAQIAGIMAGASPDAYAGAFAAIAAQRKDLEDRRGVLSRAIKQQAAKEQAVLPQSAKERSVSPAGEGQETMDREEGFKARALEIAHAVLTSPDVPGAKKRQIVATLIEKVVCQKDGADIWFLPGVIEMSSSDDMETPGSNGKAGGADSGKAGGADKVAAFGVPAQTLQFISMILA